MKNSFYFLKTLLLAVLVATFLHQPLWAKSKIESGADDEDEVKSTISSDPYAGGGKKHTSTSTGAAKKPASGKVAGVTVDEKNNKLILATPIRFDDNNNLAIPSQGIVLKVVDLLKQNPQMRTRIIVYTDSLGPDQKNLENTQKRAQSLGVYMMQNGIDMSRFELVGMGDRELIASDETKEGREKNRRVEFLLLTPIQVPTTPTTPPPPAPEAPITPPPAPVAPQPAPAPVAAPVVAPAPVPAPVEAPPAVVPAQPIPQPAPVAPVTPPPTPAPTLPNPLSNQPVQTPPPPVPAVTAPQPAAPAPLPTTPTPPPAPTAIPVAPPPPAQ